MGIQVLQGPVRALVEIALRIPTQGRESVMMAVPGRGPTYLTDWRREDYYPHSATAGRVGPSYVVDIHCLSSQKYAF
jgi:hypothetical protein